MNIMTDESPQPEAAPIDPPDNQGGGNVTTTIDPDEWTYGIPIDPPDNQGAGTES